MQRPVGQKGQNQRQAEFAMRLPQLRQKWFCQVTLAASRDHLPSS